ncbi:hypothetical protein KUCAC02_004145 [Chaenocephalus aceratus]|uniref:Uncharacterized protein n=1 Tax=Chaenocephalus aceratus TaxID=36190 RepID=A0ACB9WYN8_CHAAC|nr:hypothetical protein KUCAC02_004145 [Chaenocephalus aceratus]
MENDVALIFSEESTSHLPLIHMSRSPCCSLSFGNKLLIHRSKQYGECVHVLHGLAQQESNYRSSGSEFGAEDSSGHSAYDNQQDMKLG